MMRYLYLPMCALILCVAACQSEPAQKQDASAASVSPTVSASPSEEVKALPTYDAIPRPEAQHSGVRDLDALVRDKTLVALQVTYGPPKTTKDVIPYEGLPEFSVELMNDYPAGDPKSKGVAIAEHYYAYDGYHAVIWYHQKDGVMVGLQAMSWDDGVEF